MSYSTFNKHASSSSGGTLRESSQKVGWQDSLARPVTARNSARPFAKKLLVAGLYGCLAWSSVVVATDPTPILNYPGPLTGEPVTSVKYDDGSSNAPELNNTDFTLTACVTQKKSNDTASSVIMAKRGGANGWLFGLEAKGGGAGDTGDVKVRTQGVTGDVLTSTQSLSLGKKYHVAVVYKISSTTAEIFIDGKSSGSGHLSSPNATIHPLRIGQDTVPNSSAQKWFGTLADLRIYDNAVSMDEIKKLDANCRGIPVFDLTVTKTGDGTVTGQGINCGSQCKTPLVKDTTITLTATPGTGSIFTGWTGACTGTSTTCQVSMTQAKTVTATFNKPKLTVTPSTGGTVTGQGISCGTQCQAEFANGTSVTLTATPSAGYLFTGWTGACTGTATTCKVSMTQAQNVTATFSKPKLTVTKINGNGGNVTGQGITCGTLCQAEFVKDILVTLTATPITGYAFTGWSDACTGTTTTCEVSMNQMKTATATFMPLLNLTVTKTDGGTVTGQPINCGTKCVGAVVQNSIVTLTATPITNFLFKGWSGACGGTSTTCLVTMNTAKTVNATFAPSFSLSVANTGEGTVTGTNIDCGIQCRSFYANNTPITLTATPTQGSVFTGWGGACAGTASTCQVTMNQIQSVTAEFKPLLNLTVTKNGEGGNVTGTGINCGTQCQTQVVQDSSVTLTATPVTGYFFTGWSGACTSTVITCQVTMTQAQTVNANFDVKPYAGVLSAIPPTTPVCVGSAFDVKVHAEKSNTSPVNTVQVTLKFDATKLTANSITSPVLDTFLTRKIDNTAGTITLAAAARKNPAPTASFEAFVVNFTPLSSATGNTTLDVQESTLSVTSGGTALAMSAQDGNLAISPCLAFKVNLQQRFKPAPDDSWKTGLKVSVGTLTSAKEYSITTDNSGQGSLSLEKPLVAGEYICVKSSHALANKVVPPFSSPIDFGTLLEGDANNDNKIDLSDFSTSEQLGCPGDIQADFDGSGCVDENDDKFLMDVDLGGYGNMAAVSECHFDKTLNMYRRGTRDANHGTVTLGVTNIPANLQVGESFDYTIQVNANELSITDAAAAYLNFDPTQLRVNTLTAGEAFDFILRKKFDNDQGQINFAAGVRNNPRPTQTVTLVTINFTLLKEGGTSSLVFNTTDGRETMIAGGGEAVTALDESGQVVIEPAHTDDNGTETNDNSTFNPEESVILSNGEAMMIVTPTLTSGSETEVLDNGDSTYTTGGFSITVNPNDNGTASGNEFSIFTGQTITGTGESSAMTVMTNPEGSQSLMDDSVPGMAMILHDDGTATVTDTESPGLVATLNSDGSASVTDEASPGTVFTITPEGTSTVTDTAYPDLTTTINPDGSATVTDITAPGLEITLQPDGHSIVNDTTTGLTATVNSDGTYQVIDPEAPELMIIVNPTDGTTQVIDQTTGECVTADSATKRGTRGFGSFFKNTVNKVTSFVSNVAGRVNQAAQKVNKVATVVNKGANFITKAAPFVNKAATVVQSWALGRAASAGPIGNCLFCAVAGVTSKLAGVTKPGSPFLGFVTNVTNFSQKVMTISSTVSKVATTVSKVATTVNKVVNAVGKFFGWNTLHLRSVRADTSPNCPIVTPDEGPYSASGTIKDKLGPVAGVTVQIAGKSATTDAAGNWEITGLTAGNYTAEANKDGYLSLIQQFDVSEAMPTAKVPLKLASLLKVGVSTQPKVAKAGDNVTYLVSVTNNGTRPATNLVLKDVIPAGTSLISLDGANCDTHTMTCTISELAAGQTAKVKLIVNAPQAGKLENTATVTATDYPAEVNVSIKEIVPTLSVLTQCTPNPVPMLESLHCVATVNLGPTATEAATGVTVVTTLPTGVALQAATTTFGTCDTSKLPTVTCSLNDLSSGSNATINLDLALKDAGLLVLTQETTVSASNYGAHSAKTRTNILVPAEIQVDLALVIDITGSMQGEIDGAKAALKKFIATLDSNTSPLIALIVFKDEVTVKAFTQDMNVLLKAIDSLKADGGGTCPEASVEAVEVGALHVKPGGQIWFSTDASPYADADVQGVLDLLQSKNIRFNATVTGDCSNGDSANDNGFAQAVNQ